MNMLVQARIVFGIVIQEIGEQPATFNVDERVSEKYGIDSGKLTPKDLEDSIDRVSVKFFGTYDSKGVILSTMEDVRAVNGVAGLTFLEFTNLELRDNDSEFLQELCEDLNVEMYNNSPGWLLAPYYGSKEANSE